jgi:hypothetical protein
MLRPGGACKLPRFAKFDQHLEWFGHGSPLSRMSACQGTMTAEAAGRCYAHRSASLTSSAVIHDAAANRSAMSSAKSGWAWVIHSPCSTHAS